MSQRPSPSRLCRPCFRRPLMFFPLEGPHLHYLCIYVRQFDVFGEVCRYHGRCRFSHAGRPVLSKYPPSDFFVHDSSSLHSEHNLCVSTASFRGLINYYIRASLVNDAGVSRCYRRGPCSYMVSDWPPIQSRTTPQ